MTKLQELYERVKAENEIKPVGVMLALPMYGGMCTGNLALSLVKTTLMLQGLGYKYHIETLYNESLIPRGRNMLARSFLEHPDMDRLMFIDSDIDFSELDVLSLLLSKHDLVGGVYPKKRINWPLVQKAALAGKEPLSDYTGDFAMNVIRNDGQDRETDEQGFLEVRQAATGFMMITRKVFDTLKPHVPVYKEARDDGSVFEAYDFFQIGPDENGWYVSEDYSFCNLWRKHGGKIYINPFIKLAHVGTYTFNGNLARMGTEKL